MTISIGASLRTTPDAVRGEALSASECSYLVAGTVT
jgi:hypothetical protein